MHKDNRILALLHRLEVEERGWMVVDHWQADLCAIGIAANDNPRKLVYISVYDKLEGLYDYECEAPDGQSDEEYKVVCSGQNAALDELLAVMNAHL